MHPQGPVFTTLFYKAQIAYMCFHLQMQSNAATPLISLQFCRKPQNHLTVPIDWGEGGREKGWLLLILYSRNDSVPGKGTCQSHLCLLLPTVLSLSVKPVSRPPKESSLSPEGPFVSLHLSHCLSDTVPCHHLNAPWCLETLPYKYASFLGGVFVSASFLDWPLLCVIVNNFQTLWATSTRSNELTKELWVVGPSILGPCVLQ